ncbi:MAG TPA: bifunctional serine/threonine-protein kinase/formylglycine-generating enzyme family protein [Xanthomonadaceae bacterium]|nr:bifunctional serine/threonine-protein kinase/formylglycine-generating enzyme family protein [Xanthomonadaceae bacterium]
MIDIAGYRVIELIGRGATASVYHAVQLSLQREVAIKVLHPELAADAAAARRFLDEARLLAALNHPHVVPVWDVGVSEGGLHYFSMRHLPGGDLTSRIATGPIDSGQLSRMVFGIAKALEHIHARGLVHRDVTPGNILFDRSDAPYLTDFGVARSLVGNQSAALADLAPAVVRYASPEQLRGAAVDHRADLYSLGIVTYEALCGRCPFVDEDPFTIAYAQVFEPVPALPAALGRWQPLIDQALAKLPEARIKGAGAFAAMVERCAPEHVSGLHLTIRAPHLEHIQTGRPQDALPVAAVAPPVAVAADDMATYVARRPHLRAATPSASAGSGRRRAWSLGLLGLSLLLVLAGAVWMLLPERASRVPARSESSPDPAPVAVEPAIRSSVVAVDPIQDPEAGAESATEVPAFDLEEGDLAGLPTVLDPVDELTRQGRVLLAARRLMLPPGGSAHDRFRQALEVDPDAVGAKLGLIDIGRTYLELAEGTAVLDERLAFWERGLLATEGIDLAVAVREAIGGARDAERDAYLEQGRAALERWDGDAARIAFELALKVDAAAPGAAEGLDEVARVGRPGYRFSDALSDGSRGPELVLLDDFALALHPVTVAEFRRFWRDQGATFEGQRRVCRDRESGWRASRRRTWEDPGFEQAEDHPVVCVGFHEAEAYARWLSARTGKRYRLPRPAEWMAAYQGPAACADANRGDQRFRQRHGARTSFACDDGFAETSPVRRFAAVGAGLYDMDGNVREWSVQCVVEGRDGCRERLALGSAWLSVDEPEPTQRAMNSEVAFNSVGFRILRERD